jgi:predicted DNA-binding transcriptional regulator AlpA
MAAQHQRGGRARFSAGREDGGQCEGAAKEGRKEEMMAPSLMEQRWFTPRELAEKLGVSVRTLDDWRRKRRGPRCLKVSYRTVKYPAEDLETWLQSLWKGRVSNGRSNEGPERFNQVRRLAQVRPLAPWAQLPGRGALEPNSRHKRHRIKSERG